MPGARRNGYVGAVAAFAADNIERTADAIDSLVENDIVLKRVGPGHVVIVRVFRPPDNAGRAVLRPGDGLELDLDEAVPDADVVLQKQGVGGSAGLLDHIRMRRGRPVAF